MSLACEPGAAKEQQGEVVASVSGEQQTLTLERAVVEHIARREGIDEAEATARALDELRLVAARRAELDAREQPPEHPDDLDPARRTQLERAAMVNLWLDERFEPEHDAASIPKRVIDANMADPALTRRLFHPKLWFVCQALIVPAEKDDQGKLIEPPGEGEQAEAWTATATEQMAPVLARVQRFESDLLSDGSCELFARIVGTSQHAFETDQGPLALRYERFAFAPSTADSFDPAWVERVSAYTEPAIIPPFRTRFGLHLVIVGKIEPESLADGSQSEAELERARREHMRTEIEDAWRSESLQALLTKVRERRVVRLSPELERGRP